LKRISLLALLAFAFAMAFAASTPHAQAGGLFSTGGKPAASPTPTPIPSALPTASPEPPSVAIPKLQEKLKANPNDQQSMAALAAQFLQINRPDLAVQLTQHLIQAGDKTAQVFYYDGYGQQSLGNMPAALYDFENASNLDPTNMGILAQLAEMYLKANRAADAERIAKRAVTFNKGEPGALMELGSVYAAEGHFDDARAQFELAYQLNLKDAMPIFQIATTYAQQNNIPMALQTIDRALTIDPKSLQALVFKADLYGKQNDDAKTVAAYDDAIVAAPSDDQKVAIMVRKAAYFVSQKKSAQAEAIFTQMTTQYPKVAGGFVAFGDYYGSEKQFDKAITEWQAALAVDPDNAQALMGLGQVSMQLNKPSDSVNYLKHYTQVSPDAQGFALLGQAYSIQHDYQSAREACGKSFEIQRAPETLGCVAGADFELHNYKEAAQIFDVLDKNAKGFLDQNPPLLYMAAKSYSGANQCTKATAAYKRLLPMMKKNTPDYTNVQKASTNTCKPAAAAPKHS
jgi:tetratricopeptide (TPR) repeat protein